MLILLSAISSVKTVAGEARDGDEDPSVVEKAEEGQGGRLTLQLTHCHD